MPVSFCTKVILADWITALEGSVTLPTTLLRVDCAQRGIAASATIETPMQERRTAETVSAIRQRMMILQIVQIVATETALHQRGKLTGERYAIMTLR
jgi:hypothetical protein